MILVGQYDSPFVRRVGVALTLYGLAFEHRPWSVFGDADKVAALNPLVRVPILVLDDGTALVESHAILDHLDSLVPPEAALFPRGEPDRHRALRIAALATGLGDKAVSLFYEQRLHTEISELWTGRCRMQMAGALAALERDRAERRGAFSFGDRIGHADIAVATVLRFVTEAHPGIVAFADYPALARHCEALEALPAFRQIYQPFIAPA